MAPKKKNAENSPKEGEEAPAAAAKPAKKTTAKRGKAAAEDEAAAAPDAGAEAAVSPPAKKAKGASKAKAKAKPAAEAEVSDKEADAAAGVDIDGGASPKKKKAAAKPKEPVEKVYLDKAAVKRGADVAASAGKANNFKVVSWNVTTLRSLVDKNPDKLLALIEKEDPDLIVLQEIKLSEAVLAEYEKKLRNLLPGHGLHFSVATGEKKGYAGTMAIVKGGAAEVGGAAAGGQKKLTDMFKGSGDPKAKADKGKEGGAKPVGVEFGLPTLLDTDGPIAKEVLLEGRTITVEYEGFYVVATYVPNSGDKLQRLEFRTQVWDAKMREYLKDLQKKKPVVWTGDLNVCHLDGDVWNPDAKHIPTQAGLTPQERASFGETLSSCGMVDAWRKMYDAEHWYTYWSVRAGNRAWNRGLRLDYFVCSESMFGKGNVKVIDTDILTGTGKQVDDGMVALDHAAISLTLMVDTKK